MQRAIEATRLAEFGSRLLEKIGLTKNRGRTVAEVLVEGDLREGISLHPEILPALAPWAARLDVAMPEALP